MSNKYLEKIAALSSVAKVYARKIAGNIAGDTTKINKVYSAASGVVSKKMTGVFTPAEKAGIAQKIKDHADKTVGGQKLYHLEAARAARAGARLARMQTKNGA